MLLTSFLMPIMIFLRGASIWCLKPALGKGSATNSLPIGLNRICWKPAVQLPSSFKKALPIGLNRICWKPKPSLVAVLKSDNAPTDWVKSDLLETLNQLRQAADFPLPIGLNRICWKLLRIRHNVVTIFSLPIGLNRICWKHVIILQIYDVHLPISLPIGLNRICWKQVTYLVVIFRFVPLPIGLNRICWKQYTNWYKGRF